MAAASSSDKLLRMVECLEAAKTQLYLALPFEDEIVLGERLVQLERTAPRDVTVPTIESLKALRRGVGILVTDLFAAMRAFDATQPKRPQLLHAEAVARLDDEDEDNGVNMDE